MQVGGRFGAGDFERAYQRFVEFYNVRPERIECAPDVMLRFGSLFRGAEDSVLERRGTVMYQGIPVFAAVLAPGTLAFEGQVDEEKMGDW
jgi:hypothetical protein